MDTEACCPVTVNGDGNESEDAEKGHSPIEEDPDTTEGLAEGPVTIQEVHGIQGRRQRHHNVGDGQVKYEYVEFGSDFLNQDERQNNKSIPEEGQRRHQQ